MHSLSEERTLSVSPVVMETMYNGMLRAAPLEKASPFLKTFVVGTRGDKTCYVAWSPRKQPRGYASQLLLISDKLEAPCIQLFFSGSVLRVSFTGWNGEY